MTIVNLYVLCMYKTYLWDVFTVAKNYSAVRPVIPEYRMRLVISRPNFCHPNRRLRRYSEADKLSDNILGTWLMARKLSRYL